LLADVEIRKETNNAKGLQQALRGILDAGGDHEKDWNDWPIKRIFSVGDKATGTTVLSDLYNKMRAKPYAPDLEELWRELGVSVQQGSVGVRRQRAACLDQACHHGRPCEDLDGGRHDAVDFEGSPLRMPTTLRAHRGWSG
jgi:hypothetical protein